MPIWPNPDGVGGPTWQLILHILKVLVAELVRPYEGASLGVAYCPSLDTTTWSFNRW